LKREELHMESDSKATNQNHSAAMMAASASRLAQLEQEKTERPDRAGASMDLTKVAQGIRLILEGVGENPEREGLLETPARVARMYQELLCGHDIEPEGEINCEFFEDTNELILVRDIQFSSMCEHHLVPFIGVAHIGYIPKDGRITGLSKLARVVELSARRLQVQERMTTQIANALVKQLKPHGAVVVIEAEHLCMSIRGVKKPGTKTVTSALRGIFQSDRAARAEVMALINSKN
jgi:GTP cyclohydrolase IA